LAQWGGEVSLHRRNARRDGNEIEIIRALESVGVIVHPVSGAGIPDLLCGHRGVWFLVEVKTRSGRLTEAQRRFHALAEGYPVFVVRTAQEAVEVVR
jgi:Holliday junction resolvase